MDRCPTEILLKIFILACTDGGRTGCSLSLVSHAIRTISSTVRFHSVALHDLPRMRRFQKLFDDEYKSHPPTVHHLFLCDGGYKAQYRCGEDPLDVVTSIISAVAPSLVSLAGDLRSIDATYTSVLPPQADFTHLRDISLSVTGGNPDIPESGAFPLISLPTLHRLHIWGTIALPKDVEHLSHFTAVAPKLSKIRLSDIEEARDLAVMLDIALEENVRDLRGRTALQARVGGEGESDRRRRREHPEIKLPQHLQQLFIQRSYWDYIDTDLYELTSKHEKVVSVVPSCEYTSCDCLEDWLEVISGGDGCWRMPPRKTTSTVRRERMEEEMIGKIMEEAVRWS